MRIVQTYTAVCRSRNQYIFVADRRSNTPMREELSNRRSVRIPRTSLHYDIGRQSTKIFVVMIK